MVASDIPLVAFGLSAAVAWAVALGLVIATGPQLGFSGLERLATATAKRWRPYRSLAVSYLFASEYDGPTSATPADDGSGSPG